jgi:hypothetical protein
MNGSVLTVHPTSAATTCLRQSSSRLLKRGSSTATEDINHQLDGLVQRRLIHTAKSDPCDSLRIWVLEYHPRRRWRLVLRCSSIHSHPMRNVLCGKLFVAPMSGALIISWLLYRAKENRCSPPPRIFGTDSSILRYLNLRGISYEQCVLRQPSCSSLFLYCC